MPKLTFATLTPLDRDSIETLLTSRVAECADAAATWARLYYEHAALADDSLRVRSIAFDDDASGVVTVDFNWVIQDGCSDICRDGSGFVELRFRVQNNGLLLDWAWPERRGTSDEF